MFLGDVIVLRVIDNLQSGDIIVVKPSHLLGHRNPKCELRDRLQCVILLCFVYCAVVLIYYSFVLNKVSCYTVLVESCCDALHYFCLEP